MKTLKYIALAVVVLMIYDLIAVEMNEKEQEKEQQAARSNISQSANGLLSSNGNYYKAKKWPYFTPVSYIRLLAKGFGN